MRRVGAHRKVGALYADDDTTVDGVWCIGALRLYVDRGIELGR